MTQRASTPSGPGKVAGAGVVVVVVASECAALVTTMVVGDETWPAPIAEQPAATSDAARTATPDRLSKCLILVIIGGTARASC
jgi:hypothetical protein